MTSCAARIRDWNNSGARNIKYNSYRVFPGVQIHNQVLGLRVAIPHFAFVAVLVVGHFVQVVQQVGRFMASLGGNGYLQKIPAKSRTFRT